MKEFVTALEILDARVTPSLSKEVPRAGAGTVFPTGITAGYRFFRTDIGFDCYYDGTRWLTVNEYVMPLFYVGARAIDTLADIIIRTDYAPYITRTVVNSNVAAPNGVGNLWTVTISGINTAVTASTNSEQFTTLADVAGVWTLRDNAPTVSATLGTNRAFLRVIVQKTGAPGAISISASVYFRLIIT